MLRVTRWVGLGLVAALLVSGVVEWGCLMDIFHDYGSPTMLSEERGFGPESLPSWTRCEGEWGMVMSVVYARPIALLVLGVLVFRSTRAPTA